MKCALHSSFTLSLQFAKTYRDHKLPTPRLEAWQPTPLKKKRNKLPKQIAFFQRAQKWHSKCSNRKHRNFENWQHCGWQNSIVKRGYDSHCYWKFVPTPHCWQIPGLKLPRPPVTHVQCPAIPEYDAGIALEEIHNDSSSTQLNRSTSPCC